MDGNSDDNIPNEGFGTTNTMNGSFSEILHYYWYECADPYMRDRFIVNSPTIFISIMMVYLFWVLYWGPLAMKKREPYKLKGFIRIYNLIHVFVNGWVVYRLAFVAGYFKNGLWKCHDRGYSFTDEPARLIFIEVAWLGLMLKLLDLLETCIFVLRKKQSQVSFLHVYHHVTTPTCVWIFMRYLIFVPLAIYPLLNTGVHVVMYMYYFLSTFGPKVQRRIHGFKRIITIMQLVQFVLMLTYTVYAATPWCSFPKWPIIPGGANIMMNYYLFSKFYEESYTKAKTN